MRGDLRAVFPVVAQLADEVERPSDNYGVLRSGPVEGLFESRFRLRNDREASGVVRRDFGKPVDGNGARGTRLREDYFGGKGKKNTRHFVDGFVAQRSEDQPNFAASKVLFQESGEFSGSRRVVSAVEVHVRVRLELFQTSGPNGFRDALRDRVVTNTIAAVLKITRCGDGVEAVLYLEFSGKLRRKPKRPAGFIFGDAGAAAAVFRPFLFDAERRSRFDQPARKLVGARADDFKSFRPLLRQDERNSRLENARFFHGDFWQGMPKKAFVIEIDARDHADDGSQNVRGVQPTAKPHFKDAKVNPFARKAFKGHRGHALEIRRMSAKFACREQFLVQSLNACKRFGKRFVADLFAVHANTFVNFFQMGRGVQPGPKAGAAQDGLEK